MERATEHTEHTELDTDPLTRAIIGGAIEVHRILGPGFLETIYQRALSFELAARGLLVEQQVQVEIHYKGHVISGQRLDLLVQGEVIVEVKSVRSLPDVAMAQVLSYLKATKLKRALIINFGRSKLIDGISRISL